MANFRKLKRYVVATFLFALCIKIRSDYFAINQSVDEYAVPKFFFANSTMRIESSIGTFKDVQIIKPDPKVDPETSGAKNSPLPINDAITNGDANEIRYQNPLFKKMMEKRDAQLKKEAELQLAAKKMIEDHRNGRLVEIKKKVEVVTKKINEAKQTRNIKVSHNIDAMETALTATERERIYKEIEIINDEQVIYNLDTFGPLQPSDIVVVIQVHNRLENLKQLVDSLLQASNVSSCLVIFSHDFYDENINKFVRNITEFRTMQIFFPFSIQMNPTQFPGRDPRDCPWNFSKLSSNSADCLNKKWPDSFGHYREATFTQIKHHWWWKFLRVFKDLGETRNFQGSFMFLEEDHYVAADTFHVIRLLQKKVKEDAYKNYLIFGMGNYLKVVGTDQVVMKSDWIVNKFNMGFVLDRRAFDVIYGCTSYFCQYDDYNWDWTLASIAKTCANNKLIMLYLKLSRVYHVGNCGTHYKESLCNLKKEITNVKKRLKAYKAALFPSRLVISNAFKAGPKPKKSNGGWGDYRDKQLCLAMANGTAAQFLKLL